MAWADRLSDPSITTYYYLRIEGIPQIFTSMDLPAGWFAGGYIRSPYLDVSDGIKVPTQRLDRKAGRAQPTGMRFRIGLFSPVALVLLALPTLAPLVDAAPAAI